MHVFNRGPVAGLFEIWPEGDQDRRGDSHKSDRGHGHSQGMKWMRPWRRQEFFALGPEDQQEQKDRDIHNKQRVPRIDMDSAEAAAGLDTQNSFGQGDKDKREEGQGAGQPGGLAKHAGQDPHAEGKLQRDLEEKELIGFPDAFAPRADVDGKGLVELQQGRRGKQQPGNGHDEPVACFHNPIYYIVL